MDRTPTPLVVAAFDKVMAELKVLGYTTKFNTTVAPYNPAQQYDPDRKDVLVLALTIKW